MQEFGYSHGKCPRERPPAPLAWARTEYGKPRVEMIWHHIVPYFTLRDCWNTLASHQSANPKAKVALHIYMRLLGFEHGVAKQTLQTMAEGKLDADWQERIGIAVAYPKWDIVEGPKNRTDDPGEDFDEFVAGLSDVERLRQERLRGLFLGMKVFNEATEGVERIDDGVFKAIANQMSPHERTLQSCKSVIRFRETMWQRIDPPGLPQNAALSQWKKKRLPKPGGPQET